MEDGQKCACASALPTAAENEDLSACNVPCVANRREFCGAYGKTVVYVKDTSSVDASGKPKSLGEDNSATIKANGTAY